jgi:predicted lipid-binding transport protein (Tim44 family)/uncharacterized membrane protein YgcG
MKTLTTIAFTLCLVATFAWARGGGGCFEEGTRILTPHGEVAIEQLRVGDVVIGGRVEAIICVEPKEYLEIGNEIHVTAEHPFQVAPGVFQTAERVFPNARRVSAQHPAYNLIVSPSGTYIAAGFVVHNKGCFLPDTPILRADGTEILIHDVHVGDELLAFTTEGEVVHTTVRNIVTHDVDEYLEVVTEHTFLRVTVEHPFYVGEGTFKTLEALNVGNTVYAYDGHGLTAQKIVSITHVRAQTRVYNLQTDAPNTYFANSIAVHNKGGGGGGGFGGGGFGGGGFHSGYGGGSGGDPTIFLIVFGLFVIIVISQHVSLANRGNENLDFVYSQNAVKQKIAKTGKLLEFIAKVNPSFKEETLRQQATSTFVKLQECWEARDYAPMQALLMSDLYVEHCAQLQGLRHNHEINKLEGLQIQRVDIVNVRYTQQESGREFTALITANAKDYYVDDRDGHFLRGDQEPARFQEFWTFQWQEDAWLLREIEQTRESDKLKEENFFEQFTDKGIDQVYGKAAGQEGPTGPWVKKSVETKATRIERLLNFLVQTDKLWDRQGMLERTRQVFTDVMLAREAGDPTAVKDDELFPAVAVDLRQQIAKQRTAGLSIEYRNLCVRKAELILVRNFAVNSQDEYTVRISAHAQKIIKRGGVIVSQDEYVTPFMEYWTFGRLDGLWKLKEVLPPARGEEDVRQENLDEDSSAAQLQWYYQQSRAT